MQALQWVLLEPTRFAHAVVMGAYDYYSTMAWLALSAVARAAIFHDPAFNGGDYYDGPAPINDALKISTYGCHGHLQKR